MSARFRRSLGAMIVAGVTAGILLQMGATGTSPKQANAAPLAPPTWHAVEAAAKLPLAFVQNAGQFDGRVRYAARAGGASVFLTSREIVIVLDKSKRRVALRLGFRGANRAPVITGAQVGAEKVNYMLGSDPAGWRTNLPTYEEIVYRDLWPGIDLHLRGHNGQLKYEFHLQPQADPSLIRLAYRGQEQLSIGRRGTLRIATTAGVLLDTRPISYQPIGSKRVALTSRFVVGDRGAYGFDLGAYDTRYPLVIDPGLLYSSYLGGEGDDWGHGIAVDDAGNAYVLGYTGSLDFPTIAGALDTTHNGGADVFVTKLNPTGTGIIYSTYIGGNGTEEAYRIAVDAEGNAFVTGVTGSADFPTTGGAVDPTRNGGDDAFVTKLDASGSTLLYSTYLGGGSIDQGLDIAVDGAGSAYVAGRTASPDFPATSGAFDTTYNGSLDAFLTKLAPDGTAVAYSTYFGGSGFDDAFGVTVDEADTAYLAGRTDSIDLPITAGAFDNDFNGPYDAFVVKVAATGATLHYSTYLGGSGSDQGLAIAVDAAGNGFVTGITGSVDFPTTASTSDTTHNGGGDAFVTQIDPAGAALVFSTYVGGSDEDAGQSIAVGADGTPQVVGYTSSSDFPDTPGAVDRNLNGPSDGFLTRLDAATGTVIYSTYLGGGDNDNALDIAVDDAGDAYVAGRTDSTNFRTSVRAFDGSANGAGDAFVSKLCPRSPAHERLRECHGR